MAIPPEVDRMAERAVRTLTLRLHSMVIQTLREANPGRGRVYRHGHVYHRASAPGAPPATDTGRLIASVKWSRVGTYHYRVTATTAYAKDLEFGTRKMAPRPYMRVAIAAFKRAYRGFVS